MADDGYQVLVALGRAGVAMGSIAAVMDACSSEHRPPTASEAAQVSDLAATIRADLAFAVEERDGPAGITDLAAATIRDIQGWLAVPLLASFVADCQIEAGLAAMAQPPVP
jgi:hypothetical protein